MDLAFPNLTRSFEASKNRVRFWGHDNAIEITFFVSSDILSQLMPGTERSETAILRIFDSMRSDIHEAARRAYANGWHGQYAFALRLKDF